jgi:hypothetical protein
MKVEELFGKRKGTSRSEEKDKKVKRGVDMIKVKMS